MLIIFIIGKDGFEGLERLSDKPCNFLSGISVIESDL